jgi:fructose-1,6-bisphosphatase/inositol monophosphatase family enzyme
MKEAVRRAIMAIRRQRFIFEAQAKTGYSGKLDDVVTTADKAAQAIYVKMLGECFPLFGIVAEEEALQVTCTVPGRVHIFFTVDGLDGTKAYVRKQSHGIGTMISLVFEDQVIAAYVGDAMTQEIFGFRPESTKVHRISEFDHNESLAIRPSFKLSKQYVLLRTDPHKHSFVIRELIAPKDQGGTFRGIEVTGGSIGTSMARLWKGEVGAAVLNPGHNTPWDWCPIIGVSQQLGFVFLRAEDKKLIQFEPEVCKEIRKTEHDVLVVHKSRLAELSTLVA